MRWSSTEMPCARCQEIRPRPRLREAIVPMIPKRFWKGLHCQWVSDSCHRKLMETVQIGMGGLRGKHWKGVGVGEQAMDLNILGKDRPSQRMVGVPSGLPLTFQCLSCEEWGTKYDFSDRDASFPTELIHRKWRELLNFSHLPNFAEDHPQFPPRHLISQPLSQLIYRTHFPSRNFPKFIATKLIIRKQKTGAEKSDRISHVSSLVLNHPIFRVQLP